MFVGKVWYEYLTEPMRDLIDESFFLLDRYEMDDHGFHDYSFIVFPAAKAYEGFVKKYIVDLGILDLKTVSSRLFRVGKCLNPALPPKFQDDTWVYGDLKKMCVGMLEDGRDTAEAMWEAWRLSRNKLFHFFPNHSEFIDLGMARSRVELVVSAMDLAMRCKSRMS